MLRRIKKTIKVLFFPLAILFIATSFTGAYFSDSISVTNNKFETGSWGEEEPPPATLGIVEISEIFYDSVGSDTGKEWVELYNRGGSTINLTGYNLYVGHYYTIPDFNLSPNSFVVIHINTNGTNSGTELFEGGGASNMGDTSASVALFSSETHNSLTIVDFVEYGAGGKTLESTAVAAGIWTAGDFVPDVIAGSSIELIDKSVDTNKSSDWKNQLSPAPGI